MQENVLLEDGLTLNLFELLTTTSIQMLKV